MIKKEIALKSLEDVSRRLAGIITIMRNRDVMDADTVKNIGRFEKSYRNFANIELYKKKKKKKAEGKKFLTDDEIDKLVDKIIKEEQIDKIIKITKA